MTRKQMIARIMREYKKHNTDRRDIADLKVFLAEMSDHGIENEFNQFDDDRDYYSSPPTF